MSYGLCPICGANGISRERRPNGNDRCENDHTYPSKDAIPPLEPVKVFHVREKLEEPIVTTELAIAKIYPYDLKGIYSKRQNRV